MTLIIHCKFQPLVLNTYWKKKCCCFFFFFLFFFFFFFFQLFPPYISIETQIWPCRKRIKGQPMIIVWTNLLDLESSMLYNMIQPQSFLGSGEEDFQEFLPYMNMTAIFLLHGTIWTNWQYPFDRKPMWNLVKIAQAVSEKKTFTITHFYTCI